MLSDISWGSEDSVALDDEEPTFDDAPDVS